jgi:dTDP-glucose 4,6-dehydratase
MKMLVTGGCGFIASNFIRSILQKYKDYEIVNLDKLTYAGNIENLKDLEKDPRYKFIQGDICDRQLVDRLIKEVDIIVHFAAESHVDRSILDCQEFMRTNVIGTQILLEAARRNGLKRFHHISTDEVFGELGTEDGKFSEETPYNPRNPYSASKAGADHLVRAYYFTYGLPITISNCSNNYGPYHFPEKLIPRAITNLIDGKKIPLHGDGLDIRDWIHVEDHNDAVDLIIHKGKVGETYCIGSNNELKNVDVAEEILKEMGLGKEHLEFIQERPGHDTRYAINATKIKKELGWEPKISFQQGLSETIKWYKENEDWWRPLKKRADNYGSPTVFD